MNGNQGSKLDAGLLGAGGAALMWWSALEQGRTEQIRNNKLDIRDTTQQLHALMSSADWIRLQAPSVRDALVGIAAATPASQPASTVPPIAATAARADLSSGANIPTLQFPPQVSSYDAAGRTGTPGEIALAMHVQLYQEPRAWSQGLTQSKPPTGEQLLQLHCAAQGLSVAATNQRMSQAAWTQTWQNVIALANGAPMPAPLPPPAASGADPHCDINKPPTAKAVVLASILPLNSGSPGLPNVPYINPQTDAAQRWRLTTVATGAIAGDKLAHVAFASAYVTQRGSPQPFQPVVLTSRSAQVYADNVTPYGFDLIAGQGLGGNATVDVFVAVIAGVAG